ncbi:MAG TPA: hypothetical protein DDZ80_20145 [Cyanobacteria bacterium UBA8803]|nr:hypothetical protein [Cyanobacteria bacterium UBA9273]HBL60668.1 hypothetical protein [Cyanobacteria bacterium UBA8803]
MGNFGKGFSLHRMTWIKPSLGWMLYRSGYATKRTHPIKLNSIMRGSELL